MVNTELAEKLAEKQRILDELDGKIKETTGRDPNERRTRPRGFDPDRKRGDAGIRSRLGGPRRSEESRRDPRDPRDPPKRSREDDEEEAAERKQRADERQERASAARKERLKKVRRTSGENGGELKRNRRMFGLLTSAIKAGSEKTEKQKIAEAKQKAITEKLTKQQEEEAQKRRELYNSRREAQAEIDRLASVMMQEKMQPVWDSHNQNLRKFLVTKAEPKIFFIPVKHNDVTEKLLESAGEVVDQMVEAKLKAASEAADRRRAKLLHNKEGDAENSEDVDKAGDNQPGNDEEEEESDGPAKKRKVDEDNDDSNVGKEETKDDEKE